MNPHEGRADLPATTRAGLLEKLMAAVRPEFRVDIYVPRSDDPVLGWGVCVVPACAGSALERGLCGGHYTRWRGRGRPDMGEFLAEPGPPLIGRSEPASCTVDGCRFGTGGNGLCQRHGGRWRRSGCSDPDAWAAGAPAVDAHGTRECSLPFCGLWVETNNDRHLYCRSHTTRWRQLGRPDNEEFIAHCQQRGQARIDYRALTPQLKLEFQYAIQRRRDDQTIKTRPVHVMQAIREVIDAGVGSVLDRTEPAAGGKRPGSQVFLDYARDVVETLSDGAGWDTEYPRDVWRLHKIPGLRITPGSGPRPRNQLRLDGISQPWLKILVKRHLRLRLSSGLSVHTVSADLVALTRFSQFLLSAPRVTALADIDRRLLERYIAWLATQPGRIAERSMSVLNTMFTTIRQHGWDTTLLPMAMFFTSDYPRRPPVIARHLAEHVMAQIEQSANLDRWPSPEGRLITLILVRCGLRASDACALPFDCLLHDGQGAPYLKYLNHKMSREAAVPIDEELEAEINAQQRRVLHRWPEGSPHLFPRPTANAAGKRCFTYATYTAMLKRWLITCDVRDEHGRPVDLTPHQWRHTFATRLINWDVPQEVVRVLLDHESSAMTSHYAKITDQTVRRHWEQATKVNIKGERVTIDPDGPLAQAQWAKTRYGMATQTLPNGYCGLPIQKSCPHANSCLTCPVFVTGPEFLPELREQRGRTLTLIDAAEAKGHGRVVEMNKQVLTNLDRMIGEVEKTEQPGAADAG